MEFPWGKMGNVARTEIQLRRRRELLAKGVSLFALISLVAISGVSCKNNDQKTLTKLAVEDLPPPPPKTFTLKVNNFCPENGFDSVDFRVVNLSGRLELSSALGYRTWQWMPDFDRDGLTDQTEQAASATLGLDSGKADTNGDGYSDLYVYLGNLSAADQLNLHTCTPGERATYPAHDGLNLCEKQYFLRTPFPSKWDNDGDGIPDFDEVRNGLNPLDPNDATTAASGDGMLAIEKIKLNLPVGTFASDVLRDLALSYKTYTSQGASPGCITSLEVSKIPIMNVGNGNLIRMEFIEKSRANNTRGIWMIKKTVMRSLPDKSVVEVEFPTIKGDASSAAWVTQ